MAVFVKFEGTQAVASMLSDEAPDSTWLEAPEEGIVGDRYKLVDGAVELMTEAEITAADQEAADEEAAQFNRGKRDGLLAASDWMVIKALEAGGTVPANVTTYRQALRDMPDHTEWPNVDENDWPSL